MADDLTFGVIATQNIPEVWPHIVHLIEKGCEVSGELDPEQLRERTLAGELWLWLGLRGDEPLMAALVRLERWRNGDTARILILAGKEMDEWFKFFDEFKRRAKAIGMKRIVFEGRRGWLKLLPDFTETRIVAEMEL